MARVAKPTQVPRVIIKKDGAWWTASMPSFPGAYGQGRSRIAAVRNLASAVHDLIETYAILAAKETARQILSDAAH